MTVWSANFNADTTSSAPASTVTDTYGTLSWTVSPSGSGTVSATQFFDGSKALAANTGSSTAITTYSMSTAGGATTYFRMYVYLGAAPSQAVGLMSVRNSGNTSFNAIGITSTRQLFATFASSSGPAAPGTGSSNYTGSANQIPLNEWVRIEGKITATSVQARVWKTTSGQGVNYNGTADIDSGSLTGSSIGTLGELNFGFQSGASWTNGATAYMDGLAIDTADWIGPNGTVANFEQTTSSEPSALGAQWTVQSDPAGSSTWYNDTTRYVTGAKSGRVTSTAKDACFVQSSGIAANNYFRGYYYLGAAPTQDHSIIWLWGGGYANDIKVGFATNRSLWVARNATGTGSTTGTNRYNGSANQLPIGEWFRVEAYLTATSYHVKVWTASGAGIHSTGTPDIDTGSTSITSIGTLDVLFYGPRSDDGSFAFRTFTAGMNLDDMAHATSAWLGPSDSVAVPSTGTSYAGIVRL